MSQYAAELCNLLVTDHFGELYSLIFSYLVHHGRQPLPRIVNSTHLSPRQVRHGLTVLIQQHLAYHYTSLDDGVTYYEANWKGAYYLVRSGKILQLVEDRLGKYAATVVSTILYLGHAQVSYLETLSELRSSPPRKAAKVAKTNGVNGVHGNAIDEKEEEFSDDAEPTLNGDHDGSGSSQFHSTLHALAAYGLISRVKDTHFQSLSDMYEDAERVVRARLDSNLKGKKLQEALDEGIGKVVSERTDGTIMRTYIPTGFHRAAKRRVDNTDRDAPRKRAKLEYPYSYEDEDGDDIDDDDYADNVEPIDENLVVRINYEKLDVALRNKRLVEVAEQNTTAITAKVYEKLLARIEVKTPQCRQQSEPVPEGEEGEHYSASVPLHTVLQDLNPALDLSSSVAGLVDAGSMNGNGNIHEEDEDEDADGDEEGENGKIGRSRIYEVGQHLLLLAQEPWFFCTKHGQSDMPTWVVEFRHLARKLRHLELERLIESRFGGIAVRIIRVLSAKGKLDEKRLQEISLMPTKDLRQILAHMEAAGFVDLQEVPRDTQRQPSRTLYLWFFDPDRVASMVLEDTYKAMARCLQRISVERDKLKHFLEKTERTDVKGNEEKYLSETELKTLQGWRDTEAMLLGEVGRLDDIVAVLRDF